MTAALREGTSPDSIVSQWDARWKLAGLSLAVVAILTLQNPLIVGVSLVLVLSLLIVGRVPLATIFQRWGLLLLSLIPMVFVLGLSIENGWLTGSLILLRTMAIAGLLLVLVLTTSTSALCASAHRLKVPGVLVQILALAMRYARVFLVELQRIRMALFCRGFRMQTNGHTFRTLGYTAGTLMIRGADRSERVSEAMLARGFRGEYQNLNNFRTTRWDVMAFAFILLAFGAFVIWDRLA